LTCVAIWFLFIRFQEKKIDENIAKFFRIEKYQKDLKDPAKVDEYPKIEEKLAKAKIMLKNHILL
jgi:hypothetical protein